MFQEVQLMNRLRAFLVIVLCLLFCVSAHAELIMVNSPDAMPETDADGFLPAAGDGYYYSNHAEGLWLYMDADTRIEITRHQTKSPLITYYLADIYVRDITCFRTALAEDTYGSGFRESIGEMAALNNALLAVNGDYYGNTEEGVVIRNGVIYRANPTDCDVCVLYYDGTMKVMPG